MREVFAPKASGAMELASLAADAPVAESALFSSIAGLLGSGGQASYSAANAVMDAWAAWQHIQVCVHANHDSTHRGCCTTERTCVLHIARNPCAQDCAVTGPVQGRCVAPFFGYLLSSAPVTPQGLPTSSMQWGAWAGAGMASEAPALASHLALRGIGLLLPQEGLSALRKMLQDQQPRPGAFPTSLADCLCHNKGTHFHVDHE